jgi:hypothetical protein
MLSTKIRTAVITLVAALSFAGASLIPTVAQAQWHTYCVAGYCTTHTNFTIEGKDPCGAIDAGYNKAYEALLEAIETKKGQAEKVHPEMTQGEAQAKIEEAEAQVHLAGIASFEWGCAAAAAHASPTSVGRVPVGTIKRHLHKVAARRVHPTVPASSLSVR